MWIRNLIESITKNYKFLSQSLSLPYVIQKTEIKTAYEKLLLFADKVKKRIYQNWWAVVNELHPKNLLKKPFLKLNNENKHIIDVYFDPRIILALNESLWWRRLDYEIPFSLTEVYNTRHSLRQMREETNGFIRKLNKYFFLNIE